MLDTTWRSSSIMKSCQYTYCCQMLHLRCRLQTGIRITSWKHALSVWWWSLCTKTVFGKLISWRMICFWSVHLTDLMACCYAWDINYPNQDQLMVLLQTELIKDSSSNFFKIIHLVNFLKLMDYATGEDSCGDMYSLLNALYRQCLLRFHARSVRSASETAVLHYRFIYYRSDVVLNFCRQYQI